MNDSTRVGRRLLGAWPRPARTAAAIIATAALALLTAACGGSPSPTGSGDSLGAAGSADSQSSNSQKMLAFSHCVRSHGVPNFPDPNSSGVLPKSQVAQLAAQ